MALRSKGLQRMATITLCRLLDAGADVNQGGPRTALRYAKIRGHDDIVQRLLKAGAED